MANSRTHPGEVLVSRFMTPARMDVLTLSKALMEPVALVSKFIAGQQSVTLTLAAKLSRKFSTTIDYWLDLQRAYDLADKLPATTQELPATTEEATE